MPWEQDHLGKFQLSQTGEVSLALNSLRQRFATGTLAATRNQADLPAQKNRVRPAMQDGRTLPRYPLRWTVERTNAWLGNFRRLVVRYACWLTIYGAFFQITCFMIVLRRVVQ